MNLLRTIAKEERGQALVIVLALFVLGSLTLVPSLNNAETSLRCGNTIEENTKGTYAAEAGVENVLWCLKHGVQPVTQLTTAPNQMSVSIETVSEGVYTLYFGELVQAASHYNYLALSHSAIWEESAQAYKYTVTVTKQGTSSTIYITGIGVRLPPGYEYVANSANDFPGNLSTGEPQIAYDPEGAQMLNWQFSKVKVDPTKTQTFYITGTEELENDYTWVVANRSDIGEVGELSGAIYTIRATARKVTDERIAAKIESRVMLNGGSAQVISWVISK